MNRAIKGALFNLLLFPGWGQIYFNQYKRGILIIVGVLAGIISIAWSIIQAIINIFKIDPVRKGITSPGAFLQLSIDAIRSLNFVSFWGILLLLFFLWIFSIIDAYLIGKKEKEKINMPSDQQSACPQA